MYSDNNKNKTRYAEVKNAQEALQRNEKPKLLDQVRQAIRCRYYSYSTEKTYIDWIRRYIFFHNKKHPKEMREREISAFLNYLAVIFTIMTKSTLSTGNSGDFNNTLVRLCNLAHWWMLPSFSASELLLLTILPGIFRVTGTILLPVGWIFFFPSLLHFFPGLLTFFTGIVLLPGYLPAGNKEDTTIFIPAPFTPAHHQSP